MLFGQCADVGLYVVDDGDTLRDSERTHDDLQRANLDREVVVYAHTERAQDVISGVVLGFQRVILPPLRYRPYSWMSNSSAAFPTASSSLVAPRFRLNFASLPTPPASSDASFLKQPVATNSSAPTK